MAELSKLFDNNRNWAAAQQSLDPTYFERLAEQQTPKFLWIGCSDSRVPANQILGLKPGEVFVHRNVANLVIHTDMSCLAVMQFAVEVLKIQHIIVCGHYGCGGVHAACGKKQFGLIDNWLRHIKDVYVRHKHELDGINDERARADRMCELNVVEQVKNVCHTTIVQNAWASGHPLSVHGLIYGLGDGLLRTLLCASAMPNSLNQYIELKWVKPPDELNFVDATTVVYCGNAGQRIAMSARYLRAPLLTSNSPPNPPATTPPRPHE